MQPRRHRMRKRSRPVPRKRGPAVPDYVYDDSSWAIVDGRRYFVVGYTAGGAAYGVFEDEMESSPDEPTA